MIFDTDILVWLQCGNDNAARIVDNTEERFISMQTYLELFQGTFNKKHMNDTRAFIKFYNFQILPLTPDISYRAAYYILAFSLSHGLKSGDALIAATAYENDKVLCTANEKHFRALPGVELCVLKP